MPDSALDRLAPDEICTIVLSDGTQRDAAWSPWNRGWSFCDGKGSGFIALAEVAEWWPASVAF